MTPEQSQAINKLKEEIEYYERLKAAIASEHDYYFETMKLAKETSNQQEFLRAYGGFVATRNLLVQSSQDGKIHYFDEGLASTLEQFAQA